MKRDIVEINEDLCDGCGICIPNCHEGALQIIDGKARLVSDLFCDGLGACLGHCPKDAITIVQREAEEYDEIKVMKEMVKKGDATVQAHLEHLRDHNETGLLKQAEEFLEDHNLSKKFKIGKEIKASFCGCPGTRSQSLTPKKPVHGDDVPSQLTQWPVQMKLIPPNHPMFENSNLLICADCVGFAYPNLHKDLLQDKKVIIGCPKLDDIEDYKEKIKEIIRLNDLKSIEVAIMEVPCCTGLYSITEQAVQELKEDLEVKKTIINVDGELRN